MEDIGEVLKTLDYKNVLHYFAEISRIPRGSGYNSKISAYLVEFAREHNLSYVQDKLENVIIYKPASPGYEGHTGVVLQGHMDMVCVTGEGVSHDFKNDPLKLFVDGDWIGAHGTTLGGDDGIAVAYGLALLADCTAKHPALEVVITTDEETGMYGAKGLDASLISGRFLINVDSEDEGVVLVSCAGGLRVAGRLPLVREPADGNVLCVRMSGLLGGHSGAEIHKYRTNAVYLMARLLFDLEKEQKFQLLSMEGGEKDNAIPVFSRVSLLVPTGRKEAVREAISHLFARYQKELSGGEPDMELTFLEENVDQWKGMDGKFLPLNADTFSKFLFLLMQAPNGVQTMSHEIEGLVESSLNLGILSMSDTQAIFHFSVRSSVGSYKYFLRDKLFHLFHFAGGFCESDSDYPAWEYRKDSVLRGKFVEVFRQFYSREPQIQAIHAGLECGLICEKIPDMDIISIGPDMRDIHTPKERLCIPSALRVYRFLEQLFAVL
ncbi:MAG: aminoacyl-histidine dipeptidase [Lachnospiraceae bacterium]|nr:aminoacyl-histidine dipeptidase [Lachnospiraceae bacterium]